MNIKVKNNKYYGIQKKEGEYYIIPSKENPNKHDWVIAKIESEKDGFTLTEDYKVVFTLEFEEPKPSCANYERDNKEETKWFDFAVMKAAQEHYNQSKECYDRWVQNNPLLSEMEQHIFDAIEKGICKDPIVESVRQKLLDRSNIGLKKYNISLKSNNKDNYLKHAQEEAMDLANYLEKLMQQKEDITQIVASEANDWELGKLIRKIYGK